MSIHDECRLDNTFLFVCFPAGLEHYSVGVELERETEVKHILKSNCYPLKLSAEMKTKRDASLLFSFLIQNLLFFTVFLMMSDKKKQIKMQAGLVSCQWAGLNKPLRTPSVYSVYIVLIYWTWDMMWSTLYTHTHTPSSSRSMAGDEWINVWKHEDRFNYENDRWNQ